MKKHLMCRVSTIFNSLLLLAIVCIYTSCSWCTASNTRLKAVLLNGGGSDTLYAHVWVDLAPVKAFLAGVDTQELTFNRLIYNAETNSDTEIAYSTETEMTRLCPDVILESIALIIQTSEGMTAGDIDVGCMGADPNKLSLEIADPNIMATPDNAYVVETDKMLFIADTLAGFLDGDSIDFDITISNIIFDTDNPFLIKGIIAAKLKCGNKTYYAPIIPATFNFANVPSLTITRGEGQP